jgi:hypothetical protein
MKGKADGTGDEMNRRAWWFLATAVFALGCEASGVLGRQPGDGGEATGEGGVADGGGRSAVGGGGAAGGSAGGATSGLQPCDHIAGGPITLNAGPGSAEKVVAPDAGWIELRALGIIPLPGSSLEVFNFDTVFYNNTPALPLMLPVSGTFDSIPPEPELRPTLYPVLTMGVLCKPNGLCEGVYYAEAGNWSITEAGTGDAGIFSGSLTNLRMREIGRMGRDILDGGGCVEIDAFTFRTAWTDR